MKYCDDSILEAVCSIIWISPRLITEAKELEQVRNWLLVKYGEEFCKNAMGNKGDCVNEKLLKRTEVRPPSKKLVLAYMKEIAYAANVDWAPPKTPSETKTESLTEESCPSSLPSQEFDQEESLDLPALDDLPPPGSSSEFSDLPRDALKNIKSNLNLSSDSASDSPDDFSNLINRFNNLK
ncbi:IST1 homolog [Zophobas morio]|uniref:IST1 homolog n=1 Tax=Zophobas morio TaxID=2755281 RepID=UPI0030832508